MTFLDGEWEFKLHATVKLLIVNQHFSNLRRIFKKETRAVWISIQVSHTQETGSQTPGKELLFKCLRDTALPYNLPHAKKKKNDQGGEEVSEV